MKLDFKKYQSKDLTKAETKSLKKAETKILKKKSKKLIKEDRSFLIAAITEYLEPFCFLEYSDVIDNSGGVQWFYQICIELTDEVMFVENDYYLKYLEHRLFEDEYVGFCDLFSESFDIYYQEKAKHLWEKRYDRDSFEQIKKNYTSRIMYFLSKLNELKEI